MAKNAKPTKARTFLSAFNYRLLSILVGILGTTALYLSTKDVTQTATIAVTVEAIFAGIDELG
jgi:hypothetical protein